MLTGPVFSQPSSDGDEPSPPPSQPAPGSTAPPSLSTLISQSVQLGRLLGNPDSVKSQLTPDLHPAFDTCWAVQEAAGDSAGAEKDRRVSLRTEEAVEKARAASKAHEVIIAEEEEALRAATDADADTFGRTLSTMELDDIPEPEFLVDGFFSRHSVAQLYGPPKSYKSFVILDIAGCIGSGIPWQGKTTRQAKVLYIVAEGAGGIKRRVRAWEELNKRPMLGVEFYPKAIQLNNRGQVRSLIAYTKRHRFGMVIFDTQARSTVGVEENSNTDMGRIVAALDTLKEVTKSCVVLVHHSGADGQRARGATAVLGAVDSQFQLKPDKDNMSVRLFTTAQKDTVEHPVIEMDLVTPGPGHALAVRARRDLYKARAEDLPPLTEREKSIIRTIQPYGELGITLAGLARKLSADADDVRVAVAELMRKRCLSKKGEVLHLDTVGALYVRTMNQQLPED